MGKAPHLFSFRDSASQQIFHVPNCVYPHFVCIKYHEVCPYFKFRDEKYNNSCFDILGITYKDLKQTCADASRIIKETRGRVAIIELISYILICGFIWIIIGASILLGIFTNFLWGVILFFVYICIVGNFAFWTRRRSTTYLRLSHFVLAVFLRAENNRFYLKKHVMLRPGYLAKWIEFIIDRKYIPEEVMKKKCKVELIDPNESIDAVRSRGLDIMERNLAEGNRRREELKRNFEEEKHFYESSSSFGRDEEDEDEYVVEVHPK